MAKIPNRTDYKEVELILNRRRVTPIIGKGNWNRDREAQKLERRVRCNTNNNSAQLHVLASGLWYDQR